MNTQQQPPTGPIQELLSELRTLDIKIWAEGDQLRYKAPKGVLTSAHLAQLKAHKPALLEFLQQITGPNLQPILKVPRPELLPLSFGQQRLWFLDQLEGGQPTYNIPLALKLQGAFSAQVLEQSLQAIVNRHESLRTRFAVVKGTPVQIIDTNVTVTLPIVDLQSLADADQAAELQRLATEAARLPFALSQGPLFRSTLLQLAADSHVLLLTMHHIISDGWSMGVLIRELSTLYTAYLNGKSAPLPELPIQYADFSQWQRQWLQGDVLERQLIYWRQKLADAPPLLDLPTDHPRPSVQTFRGRKQQLRLDQALTQHLKDLSQQSGVTLFMTLLTTFTVLLSRYSRQKDIVVGTPIANRHRSEVESLIGFFVNTLALRTDLSENLSFLSLLHQVRQTALDAYAHQDVPFEKLIEVLNPDRNLSHHPLFQVMFVLQNAGSDELELPNLTLTKVDFEQVTAKFDLTLSVSEHDQGLTCSWEYNSDLFEAATIQRLAGHFQTLLHGVVANPQEAISDLPLLTVAERQQLLVEWNHTQTDYPKHASIHQLFEQQVEQTPDAIALIHTEKSLTYQALNRRANQLAYELRTAGVTTKTLVGICVERSLEMVIGLLAILKAGGTYVPLDPAYPDERLAFMLQDTQVSVLLTEEKFLDQFASFSTQLICLDRNAEGWERHSAENLPHEETADSLAYVMYTSGSTGTPKGVSVRHRGVVRLVKNTNYIHIDANDVFLQLAPIAFDAATLEIWGALLNGARLVLCPQAKPTLTDIGQVIAAHKITILWLTAGLFHLMVDENLDALKSVRQLLAGGDVLSVPHVKKVVETLDHCTLINGYGPTENTTFTCCHAVTDLEKIGHSVPIGRPIANTQVYILDDHCQPVPIGVPGELYTGGDGVAQGYFNRPELSQERFSPNPFAPGTDDYLYKTGDLVRYRLDGTLEFLGRIDNQVKIRGFRIELGEINTVISQHPGVKEAVVITHDGSAGYKQLVAYIVAKSTSAPEISLTVDDLCGYLTAKMPDYMVPSAFIFLEALPITANGKINRRKLPQPTDIFSQQSSSLAVPQNAVEQKLCQIWEQVLGTYPIGITDNFFDLGGHSLLAIQLCTRIEKDFDQTLPLTTLFQAPTVRQLAQVLHTPEITASSSVVVLQGEGEYPPLFFINSVGHARRMLPYFKADQPFYGLSIFGTLGTLCKDTGHTAIDYTDQALIEAIASLFIQDIKQISPQGPYFLSGFCRDSKLTYEVAQQLIAQGEQVSFLAFIDAIWGVQDSTRNRYWFNLRHSGFSYVWSKACKTLRRNFGALTARLFSKGDDSVKQIQENVLLLRYDKATETYRPKPYAGKVVSILCDELMVCDHSEMRAMATGGLDIYAVPGYHTLLFEKPYIQGLTEQLMNNLKEAQTSDE